MKDKGVSKMFWLKRNFWRGSLGMIAVLGNEHNLHLYSFCVDRFRLIMGRPFLRKGQKKPMRLITEERYQELMKSERREE